MPLQIKCTDTNRINRRRLGSLDSASIYHQSFDSSSFRILSLTSRRPPTSALTLLGLRVSTSFALSILLLSLPGLVGILLGLAEDPAFNAASESAPGVVAGISSHSSPPTSIGRRKNGQSFARSSSDSCASALEIGTGEDLRTATAISDTGIARRLRTVVEPPGLEKSLRKSRVS